jgi:hypothetical protein
MQVEALMVINPTRVMRPMVSASIWPRLRPNAPRIRENSLILGHRQTGQKPGALAVAHGANDGGHQQQRRDFGKDVAKYGSHDSAALPVDLRLTGQ